MTTDKKRYVLTAWFVLLSLILTHPLWARSLKKDLNISVRDKKVRDLNSEGLTYVFLLNVASTTPEPCSLIKYDFRFVVDNEEYLRLEKEMETPIALNPAGGTLISLPVKVTYSYLFKVLPGAEKKDRVACYFVGGLTFTGQGGKRERLPVALAGEFPIFKEIEVLFRPLEVKNVTVGGADLTFGASFRNLNPYDLELESLRFSLEIGEKKVGEGRIRGPRLLKTGEEEPLSLPLLLEFFEIGNDLYSILKQAEVPCRLFGEVEFSMPWGKFKLPFDRGERLTVAGKGTLPLSEL